mmetsp:Transcript_17766/g.27474  ORF Transcript_17766/g.27474 Transcript_17766/m.27474 type:complete len:80 (+) Transcript_17766:3375-3614(+)
MTDQQYFQALENHQDPHEYMIQESQRRKPNDSRDYGSETAFGETTQPRKEEDPSDLTSSKRHKAEGDSEFRKNEEGPPL